jgi:hypothetical protein
MAFLSGTTRIQHLTPRVGGWRLRLDCRRYQAGVYAQTTGANLYSLLVARSQDPTA